MGRCYMQEAVGWCPLCGPRIMPVEVPNEESPATVPSDPAASVPLAPATVPVADSDTDASSNSYTYSSPDTNPRANADPYPSTDTDTIPHTDTDPGTYARGISSPLSRARRHRVHAKQSVRKRR